MVFYTSFNNISAISWWSVFLVEYPEKTTNLPQVKYTLPEQDSNSQVSGDRQLPYDHNHDCP